VICCFRAILRREVILVEALQQDEAGARAGARLLAAAEGSDGGDGGAVALLSTVRDLIREEGSMARLVRPHLIKALSAVAATAGGGGGIGGGNRFGNGQTVSLGDDGDRIVSSQKQTLEMKELVTAAVKGAELCILALDSVEGGGYTVSHQSEKVDGATAAAAATATAVATSIDEVFADADLLHDVSPPGADDNASASSSKAVAEDSDKGGVRHGQIVSSGGKDIVNIALAARGHGDDDDDDDDDDEGVDRNVPADHNSHRQTAIPTATTSSFAMCERRSVAHAVLDALGPAARRNGCVGPGFAASARAVFNCMLTPAAATHRLSTRTSDASTSDTNPTDTSFGIFGTRVERRVFKKGGVCPRVAVRFSSILRLKGGAVMCVQLTRLQVESGPMISTAETGTEWRVRRVRDYAFVILRYCQILSDTFRYFRDF